MPHVGRRVGQVRVPEEFHTRGVDDAGVGVLLEAAVLVLVGRKELGVTGDGEVERLADDAGQVLGLNLQGDGGGLQLFWLLSEGVRSGMWTGTETGSGGLKG